MKKLSDASGRQLSWTETNGSGRLFELRSEEQEIFATLCLEKSYGTLATAEMPGESWTFKRVGFFNPKVTIRHSGSQENLAMYEPKFWGDGMLRFEDGREFMWRSTNFWATQWTFLSTAGLPIFTFEPAKEKKWKDVFKTQALVEIESEGWREKHLGLLLAFGWYLVIMHEQEAAAGAAATACS